MKRTMKVIPIALILVLLIATATLFAVLPVSGDEAEAAFQPLAGLTFSDFLNAQYGSGGNSGTANITKGGITFQVGTIKDKGTDYLQVQEYVDFIISFSLPQDINNVAITIYMKYEMPEGFDVGGGNIRVNYNLSNEFANPLDNNGEIAGTYRLNSFLFSSENNNSIRLWFNIANKDYKIIDLQFSAKYTTNPDDPTTHTVLLDKNGGSGGADSVEVTNSSAMPKITSLPTRSGYSFKGYYSAKSGGTQYYKADGTSAKNWDKNYGATLYAQWIQSSTVTLNKNNGTGGTNSVVAEPGKAMPTANMPSRTGYTFQGYYDTSATTGGTKYYNADGTSARNWDKAGNQTLWARWTANQYSITYKDQGNANFSGSHASGYPTTHTYGTATTLKSASKTGYTFGGWFTNQNCTGSAVTSLGATTYTANIILYAKWTANKYTVTLDDNGGSGGPGSVEVYFDSNFAPIASAQRPTKAGYTFAGYYDEQNADGAASPSGTLYILGTGVAYTAWNKPNDATLYAYYTKDMTVSSAGYEADYDGSSHTITVTVTDPASGYFILYHDPETLSNTDVNPAKTNVCDYTDDPIDFYVSKAGYTQYQGSATIVIKEVDKIALSALIDEVSDYYDGIKDDYPTIASTLEGHKQQIINDYITNKNVTAEQVAAAIDELAGYLSTAKVDVTETKIDAIGSGVYSAERAAKIEDARNYYDTILSVAEKENVDNYADLQAAEALYGPVGNVVNEINALRTITNPQEFNTAVQTARAHYEGLDSSRKAVFPADTLKVLTDSEAIIPVVTEINAIGASADTDAFRNAVTTARTNFDALTDDQEEIFPASVLKVLTDDEAAINVMDLINAIGDVAYNSTSKGKIDDANMAYDLLDNTQKALVANVGKLTQANTDYDKVDTFVNAVNAIGPVVYTEGCKDLIDAARDAYEDLSQYQKSIVPNESYVTLLNDEAAYDAMDIISAIAPIANDDATRQRLEDAQAAVYDLTPAQLALVTPSFLDYLANAVAVVDFMDEVNAIGAPQDTQAFRDAVEAARDTYDNGLNAAQKALVPASVLATLTDDEAIIPVMDEIGDIGTPANTAAFRDAVEDARDSYDGLTPEQKAIFPADTLGILTDDEAIIDVLDKIDAIGDYEYSDDCKDLIDEAREAYDGLTDSQKARFPQEDLGTLVDDEKAYDFMDKVEKIGAVENTPESLEKVIAARDAFNNMTDGQKALVDPDCIDTFADALAAATAIDKINAIGEVEYTPEDKALIEEARNYYNALPAEQKALVPEGTLAALVKAEQDYAAVQAEVEKIVAIENIRYDEDSKNIILAARQAYEALTEDQKAFFPEDTLNDLIGKEKAYETIEKIAAIGTVEYTEENKALIDEARAAYDALTPEQKALIHADDLQVLTISEETYATKDGKAKALYTSLLVIVCLIICLCLLVLAYIIYRIMDSKKKNSKVLSIAFLPLLLGASHYIDSPFIALYVLSGIALVLLVADIILALKYPHFFKDIKEFFTKKDKDEQDNAEAKEEPVSVVAPVAEVAATETNEEDEDEVLYVTDTSGNIFQIRFVKSFTAKLIQSSDETKAYYKELKNEILSYKGVKDRVSWHYDSHNYGRNQVIKFGVRGKTLCVYYALDIVDLKGSKYKVELCESSKYAAVPCMYRIRNDRRCAYAKDLIAMVAAKFGLVKGAQADVDYSFPYEDTQTLVNKGLVKELKTAMDNPAPAKKGAHHAVTVQEADAEMTDEVAITYIIDDVEGKEHNGKKGIINIDVLSNNFNDGDKVDIEALWEKKLIATNIGQVKLLAKGSIDKALDVDLQDYSLQAVKMIILAGGTVHKAK